MRAIVQRVSEAQVVVDSKIIGAIQQGIMVLIGFNSTDGEKELQYILDKLIHLRIFEDELGKMNRSVLDISGGILIVPNFTLYGDCRHGRRPSYSEAALPAEARGLFDRFCSLAKSQYSQVEQGEFQAKMQVSLLNDGPVTLLIDSEKTF